MTEDRASSLVGTEASPRNGLGWTMVVSTLVWLKGVPSTDADPMSLQGQGRSVWLSARLH